MALKTIVHVNKQVIASNAKNGTNSPPITVKTYKENIYSNEVELVFNGNVIAKFVYKPDKPLSCGARLWLETKSESIISDGQTTTITIK